MYAVMRRMPAERAHHAKRLGHVQPAPLPILANVGTTASTPSSRQNTPTPASPVHSSSSAPSPTTLTLSSAVTTPSPSVASSTGLHPLSTTRPSASLVTPSTAFTSTTLSSPSLLPPNASTSALSHSGLSAGAIAGIIAGVSVVGAVLVMFFVRKTALRRRERISWSGAPGVGVGTFDESKPLTDTSEPPESLNSAAKSQWVPPPSPFEPHGQAIYSTPLSSLVPLQPATYPVYATPTPPPATYNNPAAVATYPRYPVPMTYGNAAALATARVAAGTGTPSTLSPARAQQGPLEATVKCTFIPTLPDELSITTGERILVIEEYDDGWGLCANVRGERGMVPRECLEHAPIDQSAIDWRNTGRSSSLNPDGDRHQ